MNEDGLVTVKVFKNGMEAEVAGSLLRANGIEFQILADDAGGSYPAPFQPSPGVEIKVLRRDLDRASKLI